MTHKNTIHGHSKRSTGVSSTYVCWQNMRRRCYDKNNVAYERYGELDIGVCDKWQQFEGFLEDMGEKPDGLTLERIDNNKGYSKDNCKWATYAEQSYNKGDYKNNTNGYKGVSWGERGKQWQAYINRNKKRIFLGYFKDIADAIEARKQAEKDYASKG